MVMESKDPVPADRNMAFVWRNSCCHDVDMLAWLFPDATIEFDANGCKVEPGNSVIQIKGLIKHKEGSKTTFMIDYCKEYASYVQRVVADGLCYGYDYHPPYDELGGCAKLFQAAYEAQFKEFHAQIARLESGYALELSRQQEQVAGYTRTFGLLEKAAAALGLGSAYA